MIHVKHLRHPHGGRNINCDASDGRVGHTGDVSRETLWFALI